MTIPNSVTTIGKEAFSGCKNVKQITSEAVTPPNCALYAFDGVNTDECKLIVPQNSIDAYKKANGWKEFFLSEGTTTGIAEKSGTCGANLQWKLTDEGVLTITGTGEMQDYSGSSQPWASYSVKQVIIGDGVTTIGVYAFSGCSSLTSVTIPKSVTTMGYNAFYNCSSLTSVTIPNSVTEIGEVAFYYCDSLKSVTIGNHVTSIATDAFGYTISKVIWLTNTPPSGYQSVGGKIHYVPNTSYSELSNIKVYPSLNSIFEVGGIKYVPVSLSERTCDAIDCIYTGDVYEVNIDKKVNYKGFDMAVREINPYTGYKCRNITKANIDITGSIGDNAFSGCSLLKSARIHKDVKELKNKVFEKCGALSTFIIEDRNTSLKIGSNDSDPFFKDCKLDSVYIGGKMVYNTSSSAGYSPFYNNTSLRTVKMSDAETTVYDKEFYGCNNLKNVSFGKGLESIGADVFYDCVNVMQISCDAELPPSCSTNLFDPINKWECKLFVPKNSIDAYKKADGWKEFFLIEGTTTGIINNIYNKIENVDVYTIDGVKCLSKANVNEINALPKGVYIVNGKKIVIK